MDLENKKLAFTTNAQVYIKNIASWGMFLAVMGFIAVTFSVIGSFGNFKLSVIYGVFSLAIAVVQGLAAVGLFSYSSKVKNALDSRDSALIDTAFKGLLNYFLYTIIAMGLGFISVFVLKTIM